MTKLGLEDFFNLSSEGQNNFLKSLSEKEAFEYIEYSLEKMLSDKSKVLERIDYCNLQIFYNGFGDDYQNHFN